MENIIQKEIDKIKRIFKSNILKEHFDIWKIKYSSQA